MSTKTAELNPMAARTKVPVYNHTNEEQGVIVDGEMIVIPAGDGMGGPGQRMVTESVAGLILKELGDKVSLVPKPTDKALVALVMGASIDTLRTLCLDLLSGKRPPDVAAYLKEAKPAKGAE